MLSTDLTITPRNLIDIVSIIAVLIIRKIGFFFMFYGNLQIIILRVSFVSLDLYQRPLSVFRHVTDILLLCKNYRL